MIEANIPTHWYKQENDDGFEIQETDLPERIEKSKWDKTVKTKVICLEISENLPLLYTTDIMDFPKRSVDIEIAKYVDGYYTITIMDQPIFADGKSVEEAIANLIDNAHVDLAYLRRRKDVLADHLLRKLEFLQSLF